MIACELGLWYMALQQRARDLRSHTHMGKGLVGKMWMVADARPLSSMPNSGVWAQISVEMRQLAQMLYHCVWFFGEEMLRANYPQLQPELDSLAALYSVVLKIQEAKANVSRVDNLQQIQRSICKNT